MKDGNIEIGYWDAEGRQLALFIRNHVPRVGEEVKLRLGLFKIVHVVWHESDKASPYGLPRVAIMLEKVKQSRKRKPKAGDE